MPNSILEELENNLENNLESARGGCNIGDVEAAVCAIEDYKKRKLIEGLLAVEALINESGGVFGLHLNGDPATWSDLRTGGKFEDWLYKFDDALEFARSSGN